MTARRHLRAWAALALILQSAWLFALVPRGCCAAHTLTAAECHEEVVVPHCPMHGATGEPCPMHQSPAASPVQHDCEMRGLCDGPMDALLSLLAVQAVLTDAPAGFAAPPDETHANGARERLASLAVPPESPPPRI